jgi:hypothetical protein
MEGIFWKLQKVMKLTQKWKDFENNGTMKAYPKTFPTTNGIGFQLLLSIFMILLFSDFVDRSRPPSL